MAGKKVLRLARGVVKSTFCKFYAEPELRDFVQSYANANNVTLSKALRGLVIDGLAKHGYSVVEPDAA